jgi:hypothetical protein
MWSCGRTSWGDPDLAQTGGCHSPAQSSLPKEFQFTTQTMIYDKVVGWQNPVKQGMAGVSASLDKLRQAIIKSRGPVAGKAQAQLMANQAQDILDAVRKDGSWGVHAPEFTLQKVNEARLLVDGAKAMLAKK